MMVPTCLKCGGHSSEVRLFTPLGQSYKLSMVQCSSCGVPVGVLDPKLAFRFEALKAQIANIDERLTHIAKALAG